MSGRRPGRGGYVAAGVVLALTVAAVVTIAVLGARSVGDYRIERVTDGRVFVGEEPVAVWVRDEPSSAVECRLTSDDGFIRLAEPGAELTANAWRRIGTTPEWTPVGGYGLSCPDAPPGTVLGAGVDPPVGRLALTLAAAIGVGGVGVVAAVVLVAVTAWRRHRATRAGMTA